MQNGSFLRWAGSKKALISQIRCYYPKSYKNYHEPFLGSGTIFFDINKDENCFLSDLNSDLINVYIRIRDDVFEVISKLSDYKNEEEEYYQIRRTTPETDVELAARFIYLNRTCYNGLYRVNSNGQFNVPYGKRRNFDFVTKERLEYASKRLKNASIISCDFMETLKMVGKEDFVFVDPPYVVSHNSNGFIEYNKKIFSWEDQERLYEYMIKIKEKEAYFIMTNAAHTSIEKLYKQIANPITIKRKSLIGGKKSYRGIVEELLFTNIEKCGMLNL